MAALETPNYLHVSRSAIEVVLFGVMSLGVFAAIQLVHLTDREKWRFGLTAAATSFAWLLMMTGLSAGGLFVPGATGPVQVILRDAAGPVPVILPAMLPPILVFSLVLARSKSAVAVLDAIPHEWLIRVQAASPFRPHHTSPSMPVTTPQFPSCALSPSWPSVFRRW